MTSIIIFIQKKKFFLFLLSDSLGIYIYITGTVFINFMCFNQTLIFENYGILCFSVSFQSLKNINTEFINFWVMKVIIGNEFI